MGLQLYPLQGIEKQSLFAPFFGNLCSPRQIVAIIHRGCQELRKSRVFGRREWYVYELMS